MEARRTEEENALAEEARKQRIAEAKERDAKRAAGNYTSNPCHNWIYIYPGEISDSQTAWLEFSIENAEMIWNCH